MASPWIYRPWLDLVAGCGAWSAPLLLLVYVLGGTRGPRVVGRLLRARPGLQLPALHGDDLPRVRHARGLFQVPGRHDAPHRLPRADGAGRPRLVPSGAVDLHGVPHVESLALHRTELWAADDVRAAQWRHAHVGRATSPAPGVRRLVRHIVPDVPFRPFERPRRDLAGASPIGGAARSGAARRCVRGGLAGLRSSVWSDRRVCERWWRRSRSSPRRSCGSYCRR